MVRWLLVLIAFPQASLGQDLEFNFSYNEIAGGTGEQILIKGNRLLYLEWENFGQPNEPVTPIWIEREFTRHEIAEIHELLDSFDVFTWLDKYNDGIGAATTCSIYVWSLKFAVAERKESRSGMCSEPAGFAKFRSVLVGIAKGKGDT